MKTEASFFPRSPYMAAEPVSKCPSVSFYFYEGFRRLRTSTRSSNNHKMVTVLAGLALYEAFVGLPVRLWRHFRPNYR